MPAIYNTPMLFSCRIIVLFLIACVLSGCGSIHVGTTEHIHVYPGKDVVSDDDQISQIMALIKSVREIAGREPPMKDFQWDEDEIARHRPLKEGEDL